MSKKKFKDEFFADQLNHIRIVDPYFYVVYCFIVPGIFSGTAIGFHVANPCINYTSALFATVTALYCTTVFFICIATGCYINICTFCNMELIRIHQLELVALHGALASTLGFYDLYTYTSNGYAAFGAFLQFFMSFFLIWISLMERHNYTCYNHFEQKKAYSGNKPEARNVFYAFFHLSWIVWLPIIGFALGYDYELWDDSFNRDLTLCL
jgi:hypothetical protein